MPQEADAEEIVHLALEPVGAGPDPGHRVDLKALQRKLALHAQAARCGIDQS